MGFEFVVWGLGFLVGRVCFFVRWTLVCEFLYVGLGFWSMGFEFLVGADWISGRWVWVFGMWGWVFGRWHRDLCRWAWEFLSVGLIFGRLV